MAIPSITAVRAAPVHVPADDLLFARHDPALCLLPGLFRCVDAKSRDAGCTALKLTHTFGPLVIEAHNSTQLGGDDLAVLQALVSLAKVRGTTLARGGPLAAPEQALVDALATDMGPEAAAADIGDAVQHADFSASNLLEIMGWPDGGSYRDRVDAAVKRLATCVLTVHPVGAKSSWQRYNLLAAVHTTARTRQWSRTYVALNPRITRILLGAEAHTQHTHISLVEARRLGTDQAARVLHQRLCGWINAGDERNVTYRVLLSYLWPEDAGQASADAARRATDKVFARLRPDQLQRKRLDELAAALNVLETRLPGWSVTRVIDRPFQAAVGVPVAEAFAQRDEYLSKQALAAKRAEADVLDTLVYIQRGRGNAPAPRAPTAESPVAAIGPDVAPPAAAAAQCLDAGAEPVLLPA